MAAATDLSSYRPTSEELRQRWTHQYATSVPAMTSFAFIAVTVFAAAASFGIEWARMAGASGWEAAVWPVAVTAVTVQAFYCRVRMTPGWYPAWARRLFEIVGAAGFLLIGFGSGLNLGGYPRELGNAASVLVMAAPSWSMFISIVVAATFMLAVRPPLPQAAAWFGAAERNESAEVPAGDPFGSSDD